MTNVVRLPVRGRWAWDSRGANRAVRVSTHARENVVNLSVWRDDLCVGTVRLGPAEVAALVTGLAEGLAELTTPSAGEDGPSVDAERLAELERRLTRIESRLPARGWRAAAAAAAGRAGAVLHQRRSGAR